MIKTMFLVTVLVIIAIINKNLPNLIAYWNNYYYPNAGIEIFEENVEIVETELTDRGFKFRNGPDSDCNFTTNNAIDSLIERDEKFRGDLNRNRIKKDPFGKWCTEDNIAALKKILTDR